jgi:hypothetical protein
LIKNQKIIVFSLISITIFSTLHYILNNKDLLQPEWFPHQRPNVIVKNDKCVLENNRKLDNAEFIYYIVNKLKEGKSITKEEFFRLLKLIRDGVLIMSLLGLLIKLLILYVKQNNNIRRLVFTSGISPIITKELSFPIKNSNPKPLDDLEDKIVLEVIQEAQAKKFQFLEEQWQNEITEKILKKCKGQPRNSFGAKLEKRALKITPTKFNRLGERILPIRNDFWCTLSSQNIKETIALEKAKRIYLQELEDKRVSKN